MTVANYLDLRAKNDYYDACNAWRPPRDPDPVVTPEQPLRDLPKPVDTRSKNELRPKTFDDVVGQTKIKGLLQRMVNAAKEQRKPLGHLLLIGPSGLGKTTLATVIANEMHGDLYHVECPISHETLLGLREAMNDGDVLLLDEIHQQAIQERRGKSGSTQPEVLFSVLEDFTLPTQNGLLDFPHITVIGASTDPGLLPTPFLNRFVIRPALARYTIEDMETIARHNADALHLVIHDDCIKRFARAARGVPREVNNLLRNAAALAVNLTVDSALTDEVIYDLNGLTDDGLTGDMQRMLTYLRQYCERTTGKGEVRWQGSVSSIATGIGLARDQKAVALHVEPTLIEMGYIGIESGGRVLTEKGRERAESLLEHGLHG